MRIIQIGRGKYRRQLIARPTARRLFRRSNSPSSLAGPSSAHSHSHVPPPLNIQTSSSQTVPAIENSPSSDHPVVPTENPSAPLTTEKPTMDAKDFEGPGWECLNIAQANGGRYYKGENID